MLTKRMPSETVSVLLFATRTGTRVGVVIDYSEIVSAWSMTTLTRDQLFYVGKQR